MTCRGTCIMFEQLEQKHRDLHFDFKMDCSQLLP